MNMYCSTQKAATKEYREGWERIFSKSDVWIIRKSGVYQSKKILKSQDGIYKIRIIENGEEIEVPQLLVFDNKIEAEKEYKVMKLHRTDWRDFEFGDPELKKKPEIKEGLCDHDFLYKKEDNEY